MVHWAQIDPQRMVTAFDLWFESDMPRIADTLTDRTSYLHVRTTVHPLTSLLLCSPFVALHAAGVDTATVVRIFVGMGAFIFSGLLFVTLRVLRLRRIDAGLVVALVCTSAAGVHWLSTPENFAWGASSILIAILWLAVPRGAHDVWSGPLQAATTLAITVTNGVAGLIAAVLALGVRRGLQAATAGFLIIAILTPLQYAIYPTAGRFLNFRGEGKFSVLETGGAAIAPIKRLVGLSAHVVAAPRALVVAQNEARAPYKLSYQTLDVVRGPAGVITLAGWTLLLTLGIWAALKEHVSPQVSIAVGLMIAANVCLHLVYGEEVFLYALHFACLYAVVAAWACLTLRKVAVPILLVTVVASHLHNSAQFSEVARIVNSGRLAAHQTHP